MPNKTKHCAACGNPDCAQVSADPYFARCPASPGFGVSEPDALDLEMFQPISLPALDGFWGTCLPGELAELAHGPVTDTTTTYARVARMLLEVRGAV